MDPAPPIYHISDPDAGTPLRQGELLSNVIQYRLDLTAAAVEPIGFVKITHPFAIILTQDCDLEQDFKVRSQDQQSDKRIPNVLVAEVSQASDLRATSNIKSDIWKRIAQNKDERYHFLQEVKPDCDRLGEGIPELTIDFKRYFTIHTEETYRKIELTEAKRRCRLISPYLEPETKLRVS